MDVGLKRTLWGGAGSLTLGVDNLFDTGDWRFYNDGDGTSSSRAVLDFRHRTVRLSLTRRFGDGAGPRTRATASADESRRVE